VTSGGMGRSPSPHQYARSMKQTMHVVSYMGSMHGRCAGGGGGQSFGNNGGGYESEISKNESERNES